MLKKKVYIDGADLRIQFQNPSPSSPIEFSSPRQDYIKFHGQNFSLTLGVSDILDALNELGYNAQIVPKEDEKIVQEPMPGDDT
jgi:hypothetical protein